MRLTITTVILMSTLSSAANAQGFTDDFDAPNLDPRWEWLTPADGPTISLTESPGWLRITVPQRPDGYNHWIGGKNAADAPMLLTDAPPGDFDLEAHVKLVKFAPASNFHMALMVAFSRRYVVSWGPFFAPGLKSTGPRPEVWVEPTGQAGFLRENGDPADVYLRIRKTADTYAFAIRRDPQAKWATVGKWQSAWPARSVGFLAKTFLNGPGVVADVDYIKLTPREPVAAKPLEAVISVDAAADPVRLDRRRYGHFIEHLGRCIYDGIWAEMLRNRKFNCHTSDGGVVEFWQPVGAREGVTFSRDNVAFYAPAQSQRIEIEKSGPPAGVEQGGLVLREGIRYDFRLVAKQTGLQSPIEVALVRGDEVLAKVVVGPAPEDWQTFEGVLGPAPPGAAAFRVTTTGPGTLWLGAASLMPDDAIEGMRRDVIEAIREIEPPLVRWPGGNFASGYDWRDGIGPVDQRPTRWDRAWNAWEWNDFGTDEFIRFCRVVGCEPYICANAGEGQAREAAAWVEYCNGGADTRWGRVRAQNGHPEPYDVRLWGLGNEMYGNWQLGHLDATNYAIKAVEMARAMRAVDPSIELVAVGVERGGSGDWNKQVVQIAGREIDYLAPHYYCGLNSKGDPILNYAACLGGAAGVESMLRDTARIVRDNAPEGKHIPLCFDEWNVWLSESNNDSSYEGYYSLRDGLFAATIFNDLTRLGPDVPIANLAQLVNVLGAIRTNKTQLIRTPIWLAFNAYVRHSGDLAVPVQVECGKLNLPGAGALPYLDAVATLSTDRAKAFVAVINRHPSSPISGRIELGGFAPAPDVAVVQMSADSYEARNTFDAPDAVKLTESKLPLADALTFTFPPHSLTILVFPRG